jgi:hypothetical protein
MQLEVVAYHQAGTLKVPHSGGLLLCCENIRLG